MTTAPDAVRTVTADQRIDTKDLTRSFGASADDTEVSGKFVFMIRAGGNFKGSHAEPSIHKKLAG
jgi:hypothetical protein